MESLKLLHDKYVFVPADKAANNVIIVCNKYYLEVVANEIMVTTTYEPVIENKEDIIREQQATSNKVGLFKRASECHW